MRLIIFLLLLLISSSILLLTAYPKQVICSEKEKRVLLNFKAGLKDPSNRLSSWSENGGDCCQWTGVHCNNATGRVTRLHLRNPCDIFEDNYCYKTLKLGGNVTSALLELKFLSHLDLSQNDFDGSSIPASLGSMGSLTYLNFSRSNFSGMIPHQLGNFSNIRYLDLRWNYGLYAHDLSWMAGFHFLKHLDLSFVNLQNATNWYQAVSMLSSLQVLKLSFTNLNSSIPCEISQLKHLEILSLQYNLLHGPIPQCLGNLSFLRELYLYSNELSGPIPHFLGNFSSLEELDLSLNQLSGPIPQSLENLSFLRELYLYCTQLSGPIPHFLGNFSSLEELDMSFNQLSGPIPQSLENLSFLRELYLYYNQLSGPIPQSLGNLSSLEALNIGYNSLSGSISEVHLSKLQKLDYLAIYRNSLYFQIDPNWIPPFQLRYLDASHCLIGPKFPIWLRTQTSLVLLDISYSGISDIAPDWLWDFSSHFDTIDCSGNQISGDISNIFLNASTITLESNKFTGHVPRLSPNVHVVYLANNFLSGEISNFFCSKERRENDLWILDLSNNSFFGGLPNECLVYWQSLISLKLGKNNLFGYIPDSISFLFQLQSLQLHNNNLQGNIPLSLKNCTNLVLINFATNHLNGVVPYWIAELTNLEALILRSNNFSGKIPLQIWKLPQLTILDLANNCLSGHLPTNISLPAMRNPSIYQSHMFIIKNLTSVGFRFYYDSLELFINKRDWEYKKILGLVRSIDLSSNNLIGLIPPEISSLVELLYLNLSNNQFKGNIPYQFGGMTKLLVLDLSKNRLSGEIPQSFSSLTFLSELDVSYNNLSGQIPSGTQLQGFNESSYIGNEGLCGTPLLKNCTRDREIPEIPTPTNEEDDRFETSWFYFGMGCGFGVAFLGVWGTLVFNRTWRIAYFRLIDNMKDKTYVVILVKMKQLQRSLKRSR